MTSEAAAGSFYLAREQVAARDAGIADYDSNSYDYRTFWASRDYEQWAETAALTAALARLSVRQPKVEWFADFGGGYGRNLELASTLAEHVVIIDYSVNNLHIAADLHSEFLAEGRLHLVRADLARLPFRESAFDASMTVRVLHHLNDLDAALPEMLQTVDGAAIFDIPIKHHLLARIRAVMTGRHRELRSPQAIVVGTSEHPFHEYQLAAVKTKINDAGFDCEAVASVNNLRRWDQRLPRRTVRMLSPIARTIERVAQRVGIGWWGPNQFVVVSRKSRSDAARTDPAHSAADLASRCCCPECKSELTWSPDFATCVACATVFPRRGRFWDFTTGRTAA